MPAGNRENPLMKEGNSDAFFWEKCLTKNTCIQMLQIMYLWIPVVITLIITIIMAKMNVEKANEKLLQEQRVKDDKYDWYN